MKTPGATNLAALALVVFVAWTHVTSLTETDAMVTVNVNSLVFESFPGTAAADRIEALMRLPAPLGSRVVADGSTGQPIAATAT